MSNDDYEFHFHRGYGSCSCGREHVERIDLGRHSIEESPGVLEYMATASATAYPVRLDMVMERVQSWNEAMYKVRPLRESILQIEPAVIDRITEIVFDSLCEDRPISVSSAWHLRLHCVLNSCNDSCHIYRSALMEEKADEYAGDNCRNPGDYGSDEERESDGDGWDDTPDSSWWERDHESELINDRRGDRRDDSDFMERAKEDMEANCTQGEWDGAV